MSDKYRQVVDTYAQYLMDNGRSQKAYALVQQALRRKTDAVSAEQLMTLIQRQVNRLTRRGAAAKASADHAPASTTKASAKPASSAPAAKTAKIGKATPADDGDDDDDDDVVDFNALSDQEDDDDGDEDEDETGDGDIDVGSGDGDLFDIDEALKAGGDAAEAKFSAWKAQRSRKRQEEGNFWATEFTHLNAPTTTAADEVRMGVRSVEHTLTLILRKASKHQEVFACLQEDYPTMGKAERTQLHTMLTALEREYGEHATHLQMRTLPGLRRHVAEAQRSGELDADATRRILDRCSWAEAQAAHHLTQRDCMALERKQLWQTVASTRKRKA